MRAVWIGVALLAAGCLFRNAPDVRFFRPGSVSLDGASEAPALPPDGTAVALRLRPVRGAPLLRERIVWRVSPVEYGVYEQRRWTELPESYVERALESALRATPGIRLTDEPGSAALRVEVVAFDQVLAPTALAEVSLAAQLVDRDRRRILDRTFTADAPIPGDTPDAAAVAMGKALDDAVASVASAVGGALAAR
jgi:ABC-type uncharacterized transport system auxiliary subunit